MIWVVYLLRCRDGSIYCGITPCLELRLKTHAAGAGSKYVRSRRPFELIGHSRGMSRSQAAKQECRIKRAKKPEAKLDILKELK